MINTNTIFNHFIPFYQFVTIFYHIQEIIYLKIYSVCYSYHSLTISLKDASLLFIHDMLKQTTTKSGENSETDSHLSIYKDKFGCRKLNSCQF